MAFCLISSICSRLGSRSDFIAIFTVLRLSTRRRSTCGRTPSSLDPSGSCVLARSSASLGHFATSTSLGRSTVVKQMLCSWMIDGYRLLKSSNITKSSYSPTLGSSTNPPVYCALPRRGPAAAAPCCSGPSALSRSAPALPPPSSCWRRFLAAKLSRSGSTNFFLWNSWQRSSSFLSARLFWSEEFHRFPARFVSCLLRGRICRECMMRALQSALWNVSSAISTRDFAES
mmetsp:Transcript_108511/g.306856  ORF Transcript_108511/g.306856 Transcript_108511/m.306856 type:complete len:230 (-) Transcript_108511:2095-2784(-)